MPEVDSLAIYAVGTESLVVAPLGRQWRIDASPDDVLSSTVLAHLAALAGPAVRIRFDPHDVLVSSTDELLGGVHRATTGGRRAEDVTGWFFAGHWYRMRRDHAALRTAVDCLRATIPDADLAAVLAGPAHRPAKPSIERAPTPKPGPGVLQRWENGTWVDHLLDPAPLVDPVTGILKRIVARPAHPALPLGFVHWHAELPHLSSVDPHWQPDPLAPAGYLTGADPAARAIADDQPGLLSGLAHYCGAYLGQGQRHYASLTQLREAGEDALDLRDWEPHDPALHEEPGFPFIRFDIDQKLWWMAGKRGDKRCWVPLSLVHAGWMQADLPGLVAHNYHNLVGLQAGNTWDEAVERACAHVVASDAVALWWAGGDRLPLAAVPPTVKQAWGECELKLTLLKVPSTMKVPVVLAVVDDPAADIVTLGFAAHRDPDTAAELAVVESLIQHASAQDLNSPESLIRDQGVAGLVPYDERRRYRDAFGIDLRGLIDPMCHVQRALDPRVARAVRHRCLPSRDVTPAPVCDSVRAALAEQHELILLDVATDRVRSAGMHVARAVVAGLARIQPAAFPLDMTARFSRLARQCAWSRQHREPYPGW
ncbi:YcaO-like family protein [Natronoglycomyces albus]|uniref:YcaO-like family protein n=1 Tax=Natronoglycomyces albus TaxID=2811108 RepID=A0A895XL71_9ACTN|nr:YcaO-like family protein [Natronoglycomyces albus]QSB04169.1 YcaO-like family protein [Natronoglycomyces albus]